jgi:hypothetical protein
MPHNHCPPSRRGHSWRPLRPDDLTRGSVAAREIDPALRVCKRCGARGRVSDQGLVHPVEVP